MDDADRTGVFLYILAIVVACGAPMVQQWLHRLVEKNPNDTGSAVWLSLGAAVVALGSAVALMFLAFGLGIESLAGPIWIACFWCVAMWMCFIRGGFGPKATR